jgi:DNA-binding CsgD family transcriptional regulator
VRTRANRRQASVTTREIDVLRLLSRGSTYVEIGKQLGISAHTVASHIKKSYRKLGVHSAAAAVTRAAELRLFDKRKDG